MTDHSIGIRIPVMMLFVVVVLSAFLIKIFAQEQPQYPYDNPDRNLDTLAYVSEDNQLILYYPYDRTETSLLQNVSNFVLGQDGRIAFTRVDENYHALYVFDPSMPTNDPIDVSQNLETIYYPLGWSPDGRYLAFASFGATGTYSDSIWIYQESYRAASSDQTLYVWDGEQVINVMPETALGAARGFHVDWSYDGRLVFNIEYGSSNLDIPPETYIWDGRTTINLSQNPQGVDRVGRWSRDGQLMFATWRDDVVGIYVWDGISLKDGAPDVDTFVRLPDELELFDPTWMDDGSVAFTTRTTSDTKEIVVWDLESQAIIRRIRVSSDNQYSSLTSDGLMILSSHLASGIPSVYLDVEDTSGNILLSVHTGEYSWSSGGYLAYCGIEDRYSRLLSIWDGRETWVIARVSYRPVQWQNVGDTFSCNNG